MSAPPRLILFPDLHDDEDPEQAIDRAMPTDAPPARPNRPPAPAIVASKAKLEASVRAGSSSRRGPVKEGAMPIALASVLADPRLALAAEVLDDIEKVKNANLNRLRTLTLPLDTVDKDGVGRGWGLSLDDPLVGRITASVEALVVAEARAEDDLKWLLRSHPLAAWIARQKGVGPKQAPRLLAAIGDPYWNTKHNRPRTVSELWAYCGWKPGQRRQRNVRSNWSSTAKMRSWLIAEKCMVQLRAPCSRPEGQDWAEHVDGCRCSPYRIEYDRVRKTKEGSLHPADCVRCGPSGKPAPAGSPRSPGHVHAMALRKVAKDVLRDLWREAKRIHEGQA